MEIKQTLENICVWHECAKAQRKTELEAGLNTEGTQNYESTGCYHCNGKNTKCLAYQAQAQPQAQKKLKIK